MKRKNVQTITFPILVSITGSESIRNAADWQSFLPSLEASMFVREVTERDVMKWFRSELTPEEQNLLIGVKFLKTAVDERDAYTLSIAYERLGVPAPKDKTVHLTGKNKFKISLIAGIKWLYANEDYSFRVTGMMQEARLVLWHSREKYNALLPAIYCANKKTAVFTAQLFKPYRICLYCREPFIALKGNLLYHPAPRRCANNFRVQRKRWNDKEK